MNSDDLDLASVDCAKCGDPVEIARPMHAACSEYDLPDPDDLERERVVPVSDLQALVDEWRDNRNLRKPAWECADELEEAIGDD